MFAACRALLPALLPVAAAAGQFANVPGTGCPGSGLVGNNGAPQVGATVIVAWSCQNNTELPVLVLGLETSPAPLPPGVGCPFVSCLAAVQPLVALSALPGQVVVTSFAIPNDPGLVGTCVAAQGACAIIPPGCLTLSVALRICIQP